MTALPPELRLTSLDRPMWPTFTKADLVDYYRAVAPIILPHLRDRPVTLGRWPRGVAQPGFAQTECKGHPAWVRTAPLKLRDGTVRRHCLIDDLPSLLWVANLSTIELHIHQFSFERPDTPMAMVLDLDPGEDVGPVELREAALLVRDALARVGLACAPMTTGSRGLHIHVPLGEPHNGDLVLGFARQVATQLAHDHPTLISFDRQVARPSHVLIDWRQAAPRRLTIAPYSLRASDTPTVATPLAWDERLRSFAPAEVLDRLTEGGDPFAGMRECRQSLPDR